MTSISGAHARIRFRFCLAALSLHCLSGQAAALLSLHLGVGGTREITFPASVGAYYILYSGSAVTNVSQPVALVLGAPGQALLQDTTTPLGAATFYRVLEVPNSTPLDSDGDGIDDFYELSYAGCLNPLDPSDASADCDGDGRSNLEEYFLGTHPTLADAAPRLVVNEIDYDQVGTDTSEFVEVLNLGTNSIHLDHYALVFVNGANSLEYSRVALDGSLAAGQYLAVGCSNVTVAAGARVIRFGLLENNIQNGAPDAVALVNVGLRRVMDSLSYEGAMMAATINGLPGTCNLVEGTVLATAVQDSNTVTGSLIRYPDGVDTDNANSDWTFTLTPTPGSANALTQ